MHIIDIVLGEIRGRLAHHAPERGGALYGPKGWALVTHFEFDEHARTSPVSYIPSIQLIGNVERIERHAGLEFKGIIHSHPPGVMQPSAGDEQAVAAFFRRNPHIRSIALPIVQQIGIASDAAPSEFLHWYRAERRAETPVAGGGGLCSFGEMARARAGNAVAVFEEDLHVIPMRAHLAALLQLLERRGVHLDYAPALQQVQIQNAVLTGLVAAGTDGHELMYFIGPGYPIVPPVVLCRHEGTTRNLQFHWNGLEGDGASSITGIACALLEQWTGDQQVWPSSVICA